MNKIQLPLKILLIICLSLFFSCVSIIISNNYFLTPLVGVAKISNKYITPARHSMILCGKSVCPSTTPRQYWLKLMLNNQIDMLSVSENTFNHLEINADTKVEYSYTRFNKKIVINNLIN